jgi:hypothetical protein
MKVFNRDVQHLYRIERILSRVRRTATVGASAGRAQLKRQLSGHRDSSAESVNHGFRARVPYLYQMLCP